MNPSAADTPRAERNLCRTLAVAIQFLTRVPMPGLSGITADQYRELLRRAVIFFPIVGGLVGCWTAALFVGGLWIGFTPLVAALISLGAEALLTGAFHEDALADTCDALGGGWTRDQVLEIMKDSRLGTYGSVGLIIGVGTRAAAMAAIGAANMMTAAIVIVAAASLGRAAIVLMMATTDPIQDRNSQAKDISGSQTIKRALTAALISLPFWIMWPVTLPVVAGCSLLASLLVLVWFRRKIIQRVGGTTGDLLGCSGFLIQGVILVGASAQ
ncbi:adenosylcobinamide-GDP ribazoletransferase [Stieleria sp. TO1_6]|uniref:adenosylcobinamide-GDP ribazoletransferase n=1 Tax=Stieleria tagensis TaxID=2956795 RepID=UPI00209A8B51|nr:adenosylcobinamide-GDP ribazoletransferase [Stieleria tagensis]MCO8121065.1 adenosylcobinamide-GDP ribazoletransferase [Stieleria tagensis]